MLELLPCPFCGEVPELPDGLGTQYEIDCDCGMARSHVQISDLMTREERHGAAFDPVTYSLPKVYVDRARNYAIKQWNTRVKKHE